MGEPVLSLSSAEDELFQPINTSKTKTLCLTLWSRKHVSFLLNELKYYIFFSLCFFQKNKQNKTKKNISPDDDALVLTVDHHVPVHVVCQSVDVRGVLILSLQTHNVQNQLELPGNTCGL